MWEKSKFALISAPSFWLQKSNEKEAISEKRYHYHDCYQLYYLYSGELYYFINDRTYLVKPGNIVLVNRYDIHCTFASSKKYYERLIIDFKSDFIKEILLLCNDIDPFRCFEKNIHLLRLNMQEQNRCEMLFKNMMSEYSCEREGRDICLKAQLTELLILMSRHASGESETLDYASLAHKTVSELTAYINKNFSEDLVLTELAAKYYISPFYLSRIFKRITGMSFTEYINGVRVKEAKNLLLKTNLTVSEISEAAGYKSCTHFGRVFKELTGITPSGYKKRRGDQ